MRIGEVFMKREELVKALRCCTSSPSVLECKANCVFYNGGDMSKCIPEMGKAAADALENKETELAAMRIAANSFRDRAERAEKERDAAVACITDLEATHRTEICEDGYDCRELGRARKRAQEAETRAEKAEKELAQLLAQVSCNCAVTYTRLRELAQADREGRVVVLPAKKVFEITWDAGPDCDMACPVSFDGEGDCSFCEHGKQFVYERACKQEHIDQIGKTVFLTREEAEQALEEQNGENEGGEEWRDDNAHS
jgi:hypothetical protein